MTSTNQKTFTISVIIIINKISIIALKHTMYTIYIYAHTQKNTTNSPTPVVVTRDATVVNLTGC